MTNGLLPDHEIKRRCNGASPMIEPFVPEQIRGGVISYGLSSYGYDIRVADEFEVFRPRYNGGSIVDPKAFNPELMERHQGAYCIIPPNSFVLARTVEYFRVPRDILTICLGKSTYARCGVIVNITPFEPEWEGYATLEISNTARLPAKIYAGEGIAQVLFLRASSECSQSYADKKGKYQRQRGIVTARVE